MLIVKEWFHFDFMIRFISIFIFIQLPEKYYQLNEVIVASQ